jgi:flavin reductase (DIM6/NTAB) family NADH-FMN oxidoreductase RutF
MRPVAVVTTVNDGTPQGATVSSLASLSLTPPLVSVAFDRDSVLLARIQRARRFGQLAEAAMLIDTATLHAYRAEREDSITPLV